MSRGALAALALLALLGQGCLDLSSQGKTFACPGCAPAAAPACSCALPPAACSGVTRVAAVAARCLEDGGCDFQAEQTPCPQGCDGGLCVGEACRGVSCNAPPPPSCDGPNLLRTYSPAGTCEAGGCVYASAELSCTCSAGRCAADRCAGVTCTRPPLTSCLDGATLRTWAATGTCEPASGACSYSALDTPCGAGGCSGGRCQSSKCAGVTCTAPPAASCVSATEQQTFEPQGTCDEATGGCSYKGMSRLCPGGQACSGGACAAPSCTAANCNGCCQGTTCVPLTSQSPTACGAGAIACGACGAATPLCEQGLCRPLPDWSRRTPSQSPSARFSSAVAYDAQRQRVVLFGGWGTAPLGSTWEWDGVTWSQRFPVDSPAARSEARMAYDAVRKRVLLFGGATSNTHFFADTWEWDGSNWTQRAPAAFPSARIPGAMAYDGQRQRILLFGGYNGGYLNDTWEWDGATWTNWAPGTRPPARASAAVGYEPNSQRMVLFGGYGVSAVVLGDTWEWNGTTWVDRAPTTAPMALAETACATEEEGFVIFGGYKGFARNETWRWNGAGWTQRVSATNPGVRGGAALAYDSARRQLVLFGGQVGNSVLADTWVYGN